ncbi:MAG TPA: hypothetical protein VG123_33775 [Streptosporangiaceae bacterium]|jgi:hypothetical protein|nr:hypothetical protein [Streptosporangiaceae bacterium]
MTHPATVYDLAQARHAGLRRQAQRAALGRAAREARRARRQPSRNPPPRLLAALTAWARRPRPEPESP